MALTMRVPSNCSEVIFSFSGIKNPVGGVVSGMTAAELASAVHHTTRPRLVKGETNPAIAGTAQIVLPPLVNTVTIDGVQYVGTGGTVITVPADDATIFLNENFTLVTGA